MDSNKKIGCGGCDDGKRKARPYNIFPQSYNAQRSVVVVDLCNGFTVLNAGTSTVYLNGVPIIPNVSVTIGGNEDEIYKGRIDISFSSANTADNTAWVIQKFYIE
jgi:hypothetical protein